MDFRPDDLLAALRRAGLRRGKAARLVAEIEDHVLATCRELEISGVAPELARVEALQRVGPFHAIVQHAATDPRALVLARRRPWLVFGAAPVVSAAAAFLVLGIALLAGADAARAAGLDPTCTGYRVGAALAWVATSIVVWLAVAAAFCGIAGRNALAPRWAALACLGVAVVAALVAISVRPPIGDEPGYVSVAFGELTQVWRAVLPAPAFVAFWIRRRRRTRGMPDPLG